MFPKSPRGANRALLDLARGKPCLLLSPLCCGDPETVVACHGAGVANGKGMGYKTGDEYSAWGCVWCNHYTDQYSGATKEEKAAVFAAGHERQIEAWRQIASSPTSKQRDRDAAAWALARLKLG